MSEHALLSASSAERWINCPGSVALCKNLPDTTSKFAEEGTLAHELAAELLVTDYNAAFFKVMVSNGEEAWPDHAMFEEVQKYVDQIRDYKGQGKLFVEQRVDYSDVIGVPDSFGTSDAIIISEDGKELLIADLKYGKGVQVDADNNYQLMLYALGALSEYGMIYNIERVRLVISQPRLNHLSEWSCTVEELQKFGYQAQFQAKLAAHLYWNETIDNGKTHKDFLNPGEDQCRWCKAKSFCPALAAFVNKETESQFDIIADDITPETLNLVELWIKGKRGDIEKRLLHGEKVPHWKLVRGKQGHRKWTDEESAEEILIKDCGLTKEDIYDMSLQSPTVIEKLLKDDEDNWSALEKLITRTEGKLSVAPADDKRKEVTTLDAQAGFENLDNEEGE